VEAAEQRRRPGGAALTAWLAAGQGIDVVLVCARPGDNDADALEQLLAGRVRVVELPSTGSTAVKTRVRAGGRTLLRLDRGGELGRVLVDAAHLRTLLASASAVLVSDYGRGLAAHRQVRAVLEQVAAEVPLVWDPHPRGSAPVPGAWMVTPNAHEAAAWAGAAPADGIGAAVSHARALHDQWRCRYVAVTLGAAGAALVPPSGTPLVAPAASIDAHDTCGAGDAFAAAAAVAVAGGATAVDAVRHAVAAAGSFVRDGAASAWPMAPAPVPEVPLSLPDDAVTVAERVRAAGGRVVMAGGCFDLLHAGHVEYLEGARRLGDCLVVAINGDESLRRLKGQGRPLVPAPDRARLVRALACVDAVAVFDEPTPAEVLRRVRPDVFAKGGDYLGADLPEADVVAEIGGQVVALPYLPGRSTTRLAQTLDPGKDVLSCSAL
jgi:rfaE bifunctional protein nucleotidyltransferase chain/domain